jgi:hypothetical protein
MGQKAGQPSRLPTITVLAESESEARQQAQPQFKKDLDYILHVGEEAVAQIEIASDPIKTSPTAGSSPGQWQSGDIAWYKTAPWDEGFVSGRVKSVEMTEKHGQVVQVYGEVGGFRHLTLDRLRRKVPRNMMRKVKEIELTREQESMLYPISKMKRKDDD